MSENKAIDKANLELALSENNKRLLEYTDNADTKLRQEFGPVSKYQRYLNTELGYAQVRFSGDTTVNNVSLHSIIPFSKVIISNNIEYDTSTYVFKLKAGKTYKILSSIRTLNSSGYFYFCIYNKTKDCTHGVAGCAETPSTYNNNVVNTTAYAIIECDVDTEVQVKITSIDKSRTIIFTGLSTVIVEEINRQIVIDPVEHVNTEYGLEDAPVGHIISHMGTKAPNHYLICDGTEYDILLYPELANHILNNFGSYNYFGGDGVNTFAVPDLRGEFLRGTGTATRDTGSGAEVGEHQDATKVAAVSAGVWGSTKHVYVGLSGANLGQGPYDKTYGTSMYYSTLGNSTEKGKYEYPDWGTTRPTNTSVLYCIKYEHTYYTKVNNTNYLSASLYSEEERIIGCWIDGKPLYEKTIKYENVSCTKGSYNQIGTVSNAIQNYEHVLNYMAYSTILKRNIAIGGFAPTSSFKIYGYSCTIQSDSSNDSITISASSDSGIMSNDTLFITFQYTKTTDAENSFTNDMIKDYIASSENHDPSYTDDEINTAIADSINLLNEV